jgi:diguanylate cyclase (GGDEF)-like protein
MTAAPDVKPMRVAARWTGRLLAAGFLILAFRLSTALGMGLALAMGGVLLWRLDRLRKRVRELVESDPLTGAASRAGFLVRLQHQANCCRDAGASLSLAVLDCDSFKQVNESFGHCIGDAVLVETAEVLKRQIGARGTVARLWGDAFGILLSAPAVDDASRLLEEVRNSLRARMADHDWPVTFSIGAVTFEHPPRDPQDLLAAVDGLMFSVKQRGRDGIAVRRVAADCAVVDQTELSLLASSRANDAPSNAPHAPRRA